MDKLSAARLAIAGRIVAWMLELIAAGYES